MLTKLLPQGAQKSFVQTVDEGGQFEVTIDKSTVEGRDERYVGLV